MMKVINCIIFTFWFAGCATFSPGLSSKGDVLQILKAIEIENEQVDEDPVLNCIGIKEWRVNRQKE